jgi:bacterioferritin
MQGDPSVIEVLKLAIRMEKKAIDQYCAHKALQENMGIDRVSKHITKPLIKDERDHMHQFVDRLLFLGGQQDSSWSVTIDTSTDIMGMFNADLTSEYQTIQQYREFAHVCGEAKDKGTMELFIEVIQDEEKHAAHLEQQLSIIKLTSPEMYIARTSRLSKT